MRAARRRSRVQGRARARTSADPGRRGAEALRVRPAPQGRGRARRSARADSTDEVPRGFRDLVGEYYRSLSRSSRSRLGSRFKVRFVVHKHEPEPRTELELEPNQNPSSRAPHRRCSRQLSASQPQRTLKSGPAGHVAGVARRARPASRPRDQRRPVPFLPADVSERRARGRRLRAGAPTIPAPTSTSASVSPSSRKPPSASTAKVTRSISSSAAAATTTCSVPVRSHRRRRHRGVQRRRRRAAARISAEGRLHVERRLLGRRAPGRTGRARSPGCCRLDGFRSSTSP